MNSGTKHHIERCLKHCPRADSDAIWTQIRAPSGCRYGRRFGRSLGRSVGAVSGAISALVRAPFGRGIERHRGAASSAIGARHRAPSGRGIERHSRATSKAISSIGCSLSTLCSVSFVFAVSQLPPLPPELDYISDAVSSVFAAISVLS